MVVLIVRSVPAGLKGQVSRWLQEFGPGVFIGTLSARVRELLWKRVCTGVKEGGAVMIVPDQSEQGYHARTAGKWPYRFKDFEGLLLVEKPVAE